MSVVYRLNANDIDLKLLEEIKASFGEKEIEIVVSEVDETEYLLRSRKNKERILQAIENIRRDRDLIEIDFSELQ